MRDELNDVRRERRQALQRYLCALEDGDIAALAAILHQAEHDEFLERALLSLNDLYLDEPVTAADGDAAWSRVEQALHVQGGSRHGSRRGRAKHAGKLVPFGRGSARYAHDAGARPALSEIIVPTAAADDRASAFVSGASTPPSGHDAASLVRSLATLVVVGLVLAGFLAVMTTRQAHEQENATAAPNTTGVKAVGGIVLVGLNGAITALRASDGAVIWRRKVAIATYITSSQNAVTNIVVQNGVVYFTLDGGDLYAVRASDGSLIWRKSYGLGLSYQLYVGNGLVVVEDWTGTHTLRASDGVQLWNHPDDIPLGLADGRVFVERHGVNWSLEAVDGGSGDTLWSYSTGSGQPVDVSTEASVAYAFVSGGTANGATQPPYVAAVDLSDGSQIWRHVSMHDDSIGSVVTIGDQFIYTQTYGDHYICTYRRSDGTEVSCTGDIGDGQTLAIVNGTVYVSREQQSGSVLALQVGTLDVEHGVVQWLWRTPATPDGYSDVTFRRDSVVTAGTTGVSTFELFDGQRLWHALDNEPFVGSLATATLP